MTSATEPTVPTRTLVLGMAHEDGVIVGAELYPVAEACRLSAEQVRSCLRRLISEGLLEREGRGATAMYRSTAAGLAALRLTMARTRLAYRHDATGKGWDRKWRLVAFAMPEEMRNSRDAFREALRRLGGAPIQNGLYVSALDWHSPVRGAAERIGVSEYVTLFSSDDLQVGGESDPRILARKLWPIDQIGAGYEVFIARFSTVVDDLTAIRQRRERLSDARFLPGAFAMASALNEAFNDDPLLPPELLPRPWPGRSARDLVIRSRRLALSLLQSHQRPTLFRLFDEATGDVS